MIVNNNNNKKYKIKLCNKYKHYKNKLITK